MFHKTAETEGTAVLGEKDRVIRVFDRLGKDVATELEILRTAKDMGMSLKGVKLSEHCTVTGANLGLKRG